MGLILRGAKNALKKKKNPLFWQEHEPANINGDVASNRTWGSNVAEPSHTQASGFNVHPKEFRMYICILTYTLYTCIVAL